jgi:hypothetical protein
MHAIYTYTRLRVPNFAACFRFDHDVLALVPTFGDEQSTYADFATVPSRSRCLTRPR